MLPAMRYAAFLIVCLAFPAQAQDFGALFADCEPSAVASPTQQDWDNYAAGRIGLPLSKGASQRARDFHTAGREGLALSFIQPRCPTESERVTYGALAASECFLGPSRIGREARAALEHARTNLSMLPYSEGRCVKAGVMPFSLRATGGQNH